MNKHLKFLIFLANLFLFYSFVQTESTVRAATSLETSEFGISGPEKLCIYHGSIIGDFTGGGRDTDVFRWRVFNAQGVMIVEREGGFQKFSHTFSEVGQYRIQLNIRRNIEEVYEGSLTVVVQEGPKILLSPSYLLCGNSQVSMTLLDPATQNLENYAIQWKNNQGSIVGTGNTIQTNIADRYSVTLYSKGPDGTQFCPYETHVHVYNPENFEPTLSTKEICDGGTAITASAGNVFGKWFAQKAGSTQKVLLGDGSSIRFSASGNLNGPGDYTITFEADNSANLFCNTEKSLPLKILPSGDVAFELLEGADECGNANGRLSVRALADLTLLRVRSTVGVILNRNNVKAGEVVTIENLEAGLYSVLGAIGPCSRTRSAVIELKDSGNLDFSIVALTDETCDTVGKLPGKIEVKMNKGPFTGIFRLFSNTGAVVKSVEINQKEFFEIEVPAGNYFFDLRSGAACSNPYRERITIRAIDQVVFESPSRLIVCESFDFVPVTSMNLTFEIRYPDGQVITRPRGEPFVIDQHGEYVLVGLDADPDRGLCPRESRFQVVLNEQVQYEPVLVSGDCFGNRVYKANLFGADPGFYQIRWINEKNQTVGDGIFLYPSSFGEFQLEVQPNNSEACPLPSRRFIIPEPNALIEFELSATKICPGSAAQLKLEGALDQVSKIQWIYYTPSGVLTILTAFEDQEQIEAKEAGAYEAVLFNDLNCEVGRRLIIVEEFTELAAFDLPEELVVCDFYELLPQTSFNLHFEVIDPSGNVRIYEKDEPIMFAEEGNYSIASIGIGDDLHRCPITKFVSVTRFEPIPFEVELFEENCEGSLVYRANTGGADPATLDIFWYDSGGERVGEDVLFSPLSNGVYSLEVRPKGAHTCPESLIPFEVRLPVTSVPLELSAGILCPGAFAEIKLVADLSFVNRVVWFYQDFMGNRTQLHEFTNENQIEVSEPGIYEVILLNAKGCSLGDDLIFLTKAQDDLELNLQETYQICKQLGRIEEIKPGNFHTYQWLLDNRIVSTQSSFIPSGAGSYTLIVSNREGCTNAASFLVEENCDLKVRIPNAIKPGDPLRNFILYPDEMIEDLEVFIYSRWGELLFSCINPGAVPTIAMCVWDGKFNGAFIPAGVLALKISYRKVGKAKREVTVSTLTVIE
jgi:hypothetical protein